MDILDALSRHPKVELVEDEREIGNGIIVTLKRGWTLVGGGNVAHVETVAEAQHLVRGATREDES